MCFGAEAIEAGPARSRDICSCQSRPATNQSLRLSVVPTVREHLFLQMMKKRLEGWKEGGKVGGGG